MLDQVPADFHVPAMSTQKNRTSRCQLTAKTGMGLFENELLNAVNKIDYSTSGAC